jgi:hypothetical protein
VRETGVNMSERERRDYIPREREELYYIPREREEGLHTTRKRGGTTYH